MEGINRRTGDKIVIDFHANSKPQFGKIAGKCHNKSGKLIYEVSGSWGDKVYVTHCLTGEKELVYTFPEIIENGER